MDLYEHQARALFEEHGIPVPRAEVTDSPQGARAIARGLGGSVVVKAQVKTGGRGKAGGVRLAADPAEAERAARRILGMDIKGHTVGKVMLAQPVDIETEFYVAYVLDRAAGRFLAIASAEGGMEIEEIAAPARRRSPVYTSTPPRGSPRRRRARSPKRPDCHRRPSTFSYDCGRYWSARTRSSSRSTRSSAPGRGTSSPSMARSPSTTTPVSARPVGVPPASRTTIRWRRPPPRSASTT